MVLDWVSASLVSAAILAVVNVIDSHLISKRLPSVQSYLLIIGLILPVVSLTIIILFPFYDPIDYGSLGMAILSGAFRAASAYLIFYVLKREEVSMVIPVANSYPILVALFAMPILGEFITVSQWVAIVIVVFGVLLACFRGGSGWKMAWSGKVLGLLMASSIFWALSEITAKYALVTISPWQMYALSHFSIAFFFLMISLRPRILKELAGCNRKNYAIILIAFNETIVVVSQVLYYWALERGPVSLVSTISSTRPVFVFIYALIISRFSEFLLERRTSKGILFLRFIAIAMIVGGVAIIYLT
jgi:uncharacterized membrane protein